MASLIMTEIAWAGGAGGSLFSSGGHLVTLKGINLKDGTNAKSLWQSIIPG